MKNSLLKNAKLNALASYASFIVQSLLTFFVSPFLVQYLGSSTFGIWKSVQKVLSFATVADGRATQALKWVIANEESKHNILEKQQAVGSAIKVWSYFLPIVLVIISILIWKLPSLINGVDSELHPKIQLLGFILGLNLLINPLIGIPDAILVGTNKGYKSILIKTVGIILSNFFMILSSYLGYGLVGLGVVALCVTFLNSIFIFYICKKSVRWLAIKKPSKAQVKSFFGFSFWVLIWSFVAKLILSTEILLISSLISPKEVSNYVFTAYIVQFCVSVSLLTGSAITPSLGRLIGAKELLKSRIVTESIREIILFITTFFGGLILLINENFVKLWMGEDFFLGSYTNLIMVLIMIQLVMFRIEGQIQDLSLKIKNKVLVGGIGSVTSILLGILFYNLMDSRIEGLFIGVLIGRILLNIAFKTMVNKMMNIKTDYKSFGYLGFIVTLCYFLGGKIPDFHSWLSFIPFLLILGLSLLVVCYFLFLSNESKDKIFMIIKSK
jgi:O-antigen/teichoic acid export membrane protein